MLFHMTRDGYTTGVRVLFHMARDMCSCVISHDTRHVLFHITRDGWSCVISNGTRRIFMFDFTWHTTGVHVLFHTTPTLPQMCIPILFYILPFLVGWISSLFGFFGGPSPSLPFDRACSTNAPLQMWFESNRNCSNEKMVEDKINAAFSEPK